MPLDLSDQEISTKMSTITDQEINVEDALQRAKELALEYAKLEPEDYIPPKYQERPKDPAQQLSQSAAAQATPTSELTNNREISNVHPERLAKMESNQMEPKASRASEIEIRVPAHKAGLIIGKQGSTLKEIQARTNTRISLPRDQMGSERLIYISGSENNIEEAKQEIESIVKENKHDANSELMEIPGDKVGLVIGKGGDSIKSIKEQSGCRLDFDKNQGASVRVLTIQGSPDKIQMAKEMIQSILDNSMPSANSSFNPNNPHDHDPNFSGYHYQMQQQWYQNGVTDNQQIPGYYQQYYPDGANPSQTMDAAYYHQYYSGYWQPANTEPQNQEQ